ncbi:MAG TPA: hypothetical protein VNA67_03740 [Pseudonocardiaceae bacterium]|nr:hypothetical protein [Pseudonocardiaceae bacterium]
MAVRPTGIGTGSPAQPRVPAARAPWIGGARLETLDGGHRLMLADPDEIVPLATSAVALEQLHREVTDLLIACAIDPATHGLRVEATGERAEELVEDSRARFG